MTYDAIVLAGGGSRRMGGGDKTALVVDGLALVDRVLAAVAGAATRVVVGDPRPTLTSVSWTREEPAGGGPAAALAAGLSEVRAPVVVVLAGDLPFIDNGAVDDLVAALAGAATDGVVAADDSGAPQWLCGAWRTDALRRLVASQPVEGLALRKLFAGTSYEMISLASVRGREPWFDCDTPDDLARAKEREMSTLDDWLAAVQDALDVPAADTNLVLDVAREVAHGVARPAAPLTTYLLGFAAGRTGADPAAVAAQIRALLPAAAEPAGPEPVTPQES